MAGAPGVGPGAGAGGGGGGSAAGLKTYFKTPEGRYKLQYEKTHSAVLHYSHGGKTVSQVPWQFPAAHAARGSRWVGGHSHGGNRVVIVDDFGSCFLLRYLCWVLLSPV